MNPLKKLREHGQSYWLDNLTRSMLQDGSLERRVKQEGLRGITSNPKIFHEAIQGSSEYDDAIRAAARRGLSPEQTYEELAIDDVQRACDVLRPVFESSRGQDGYVSLELSPHLARDGEGSTREAVRLHRAVGRDNCLIKIPGTKEGLRAIEESLYQGVNVNITLLFSVQRYRAVAEAHLRALERRAEEGKPVDDVASVASFFLSRIDVLVNRLLSQRPGLEAIEGKAAVASAKLAYADLRERLASERWLRLAKQGARPQRLLWASTSTKTPGESDVKYVEPLIGPNTVSTMPERTIAAFAEHGVVRETVERGVDDAFQVMSELARSGIVMEEVTARLVDEGIQKFIEPYDALLDHLSDQLHELETREQTHDLERMAQKLRADVIRMTTQAGSGHPTSCMSAAELVAALFFRHMRWDPHEPTARNVDQMVLSKGHAAPVLWAALSEASAIEDDLSTLRQLDSTLEGHPTPRNPWVRVATGSLGQGLSAANGIALANRLDGLGGEVFCLLGDGECSEGSVWEAAQFASLHSLSAITAIVDDNALGQSAPTPYGHHTDVFRRRFEAFGWNAMVVDGHDMSAILDALHRARRSDTPTAIVARTVKGRGVSFLEGKDGWHGKALDEDQMARALRELGDVSVELPVRARRVGPEPSPAGGDARARIEVSYQPGEEAATRDGYGSALEKLGAQYPELVVLDGDVKGSCRTKGFAEHFPERFFEGYIAEQNLAGVALGLSCCGKIANFATFAAFMSRAYDFIRMAGHSRARHLVFTGSHAGVSIGQDGPSQMGLEDIAMFRAIAGSTVLYPSDAVSAERLTQAALGVPGIVYLRTTRPKTKVLYSGDEEFSVGGSKVLRQSDRDEVTIVAAGITVHEALAAHETLQAQGMNARVVDAYSVKPIDAETLRSCGRSSGKLLVVEDHWYEGGLGDAVAAAIEIPVAVHRLAITQEPRSGAKSELLDRYGISRRAIVDMALSLRR